MDRGAVADAVRRSVRGAVHPLRMPLSLQAQYLPAEPVPPEQALAGAFEPFEVGSAWGGRWGTTWFRCTATVPREWAGRPIEALVHLGGGDTPGFSAEGLVYGPDGLARQGLHHRHRAYPLFEPAAGGEAVEFFVEAAANPTPKWHRKEWPLLDADYGGRDLYVLEQADLAAVDPQARELWWDARSVLQMAQQLPDMAERAFRALDLMLEAVSGGDPTAARKYLRTLLDSPSRSTPAVTAVGHAHIDSAWLWPVRETRRKCARTFANQLRLMERYPDHHFVCSQAVQYQWIKEDHPHLYAQIAERVAEGRWEPVGGMWVEPDSNVPSGESLIRQIVHGKRFFLDEFGLESHELWIPDVFGYSAALPQIANQAGITSLVTQKMSWNDTNRFPHSTFWWEGHDGSRLLAHFPPADTYNGDFSAGEVARSAADLGRSLYPYGYGDGGGGPTAEMLEAAARFADVEGLPRVAIGSVDDFLDDVRSDADRLATWVGELYLEYHRGTYTTHADVKLANRRAEEALRAAEMWSVAAGVDSRDALDAAWKTLLLNQFHDILPGSSIHWVYEDAARDHEAVLETARHVAHECYQTLTEHDSGASFFNASSYDRTEVVHLPDGTLGSISVAACAWAPAEAGGPAETVTTGDNWMDNSLLRVTWDSDGLLTSIWDHESEREVLAPHERGNLFQIHEDHPKAFDAWDVDREYLDTRTDLTSAESVELVDQDPLRAGVRVVRRFGSSRIDQVMRLTAGSRRIDFHTEVDWQERHRFLKVAFPVDVRSSRATYEIQHGHVERPTVENTSWDTARFEVCAHRWADLSEPGYGVALLNDCKYGYDIRGNVLRLSLLRGPGYPDPEADRGVHRFSYALLPHAGDLRGGGRVIEEAEAFNQPLVLVPGRAAGQVVSLDRPGVSVEAIKWADRGDGVIVRLCEVYGSRGPVRVTLNRPFDTVRRTDLLERELEPLAHDGSSVSVDVRPFELVTLLFS